ncbi:MAG: ribonuclease P protein component [Chloroflexota bacterium]|nr:MAG: ribonuclease P protein component [Chloroflexota bacterium]
MGVKRSLRLTSSIDIKRVRRFGSSLAHPLLVLIGLPNDRDYSRFAVSAGRSVGNAVQRNRAKRLIRAAIQELFPIIANGWDFVILARRPLADANYQKTQAALESLFRKSNFVRRSHGN